MVIPNIWVLDGGCFVLALASEAGMRLTARNIAVTTSPLIRSSKSDLKRDLGFTAESLGLLEGWNQMDKLLHTLAGVILRCTLVKLGIISGGWVEEIHPLKFAWLIVFTITHSLQLLYTHCTTFVHLLYIYCTPR